MRVFILFFLMVFALILAGCPTDSRDSTPQVPKNYTFLKDDGTVEFSVANDFSSFKALFLENTQWTSKGDWTSGRVIHFTQTDTPDGYLIEGTAGSWDSSSSMVKTMLGNNEIQVVMDFSVDNTGEPLSVEVSFSSPVLVFEIGANSLMAGSYTISEKTTDPGNGDDEDIDSAVLSIMEEFNFAGASLAVVRDDQIVYTQAYGYSDRENSIAAKPADFFRIASVSKLITAVTIFTFIEDEKITLDDKVFGNDSILGDDFGAPGMYVGDISVRHLLEYGSGFADGGSGITQADRIRSRVTGALTHPPGTSYVYKNIDYLILGRIIEKITGSTYEHYVQDTILSFCGITDMAIGGSEKKPNEVNYYTPSGPLAIASLSMSDSAGGWVASASDLAQFFIRINRNPTVEDILSSTYTSYTPTPAAAHVNNLPPFADDVWFYFGDMAGTRAVMCKLDERTGYVLLINTSVNDDNPRYYTRLSKIETAIYNIME